MPELPEVETIRRDLQRVLVGRRIAAVDIRKAKVVQGNRSLFIRTLKGNTFSAVGRRGKLLIFSLKKGDYSLLVHLKMTGQLIYQDENRVVAGGHPFPLLDEELPNKYSHVIFGLGGKGGRGKTARLFFNDMRQFGFLRLVTADELIEVLAGYGIEPGLPDFTREAFGKIFERSNAPVKAVLLNQAKIAGLGNIYVDEVLFAAGVRPTRRAQRLSGPDIDRLYRAVKRIVPLAVKHRGTTFGMYRDGLGAAGNFVKLLKVYGRAGETCKKCRQATIKKITVAQRGTHYCPECQR